MLNILAISGSLRKASLNSTLLRAIKTVAENEFRFEIYSELEKVPLFNPDLEGSELQPIIDLRKKVRLAHGIIIASPEYAHGVSGVLKNALDWLVGSEEFINKPVALLNTSSRATHAYSALTEIITVMTGKIIKEASLTIPISPGKPLDENEIASNPEFSVLIRRVIFSFKSAIIKKNSEIINVCE